jgi:hypothetical protein
MRSIFVRTSRPDAYVWPGRRLLAVLDALLLPALCVYGVMKTSFTTGLVGVTVIAFAICVASWRVKKALVSNERYRFSTRRLLLGVACLLAVGLAFEASQRLLGS